MELVFGIERETHRMSREGHLSRRPQPESLLQPAFTKDFSETQLEIVTRPHDSLHGLLSELERLTLTAREAVQPELLWPFSMPPRLPPAAQIPIASLGAGKKAREGELYRQGLALRYGAERQMICGLHVNVSVGEGASDERYLTLARNLYADLPHLILLTGASPLAGGLSADLRAPAVSYRNSPYGYAGREFRPYLDLTSVRAYTDGLARGLSTQSDRFRRLGLVRDGAVIQLNSRVFQREKEFYAPIRLKRTPLGESSGLLALERRGVEYLELRFLDMDPFASEGVTMETLMLLSLFIRDGIEKPAGSGSPAEIGLYLEAAEETALTDPSGADDKRFSRTRARLESLRSLARALDGEDDAGAGIRYSDVLENAVGMTVDPGRLPSARLLEAFRAGGRDWTTFGMETARAHSPEVLERSLA